MIFKLTHNTKPLIKQSQEFSTLLAFVLAISNCFSEKGVI